MFPVGGVLDDKHRHCSAVAAQRAQQRWAGAALHGCRRPGDGLVSRQRLRQRGGAHWGWTSQLEVCRRDVVHGGERLGHVRRRRSGREELVGCVDDAVAPKVAVDDAPAVAASAAFHAHPASLILVEGHVVGVVLGFDGQRGAQGAKVKQLVGGEGALGELVVEGDGVGGGRGDHHRRALGPVGLQKSKRGSISRLPQLAQGGAGRVARRRAWAITMVMVVVSVP